MILTFPGTQPGIDISRWQWPDNDPINFQAVADHGVKFCIIRVGVSEHYEDPYFARSVDGCREAGIHPAAYHVFDPYVSISPEDQIAWFAELVEGHDIKLARGDFELPWQGYVGAPSVGELRDHVYRFLIGMDQVIPKVTVAAATESGAGVYTADWWWSGPLHDSVLPKDPPSDDDPLIRANGWSLWTADYGANNGQVPSRMAILPAGWRPGDEGTGKHKGWEIWQFTSAGHVPGIASGLGNVDLNIMRNSLYDATWGEAPPPPPPDDRLGALETRVDNIVETLQSVE